MYTYTHTAMVWQRIRRLLKSLASLYHLVLFRVKEGEGGKEPPKDPTPVQIRLFERHRSDYSLRTIHCACLFIDYSLLIAHYSLRLPANPVHTSIHTYMCHTCES